MEWNQIVHGDSYEILPTLPDKSFDTVIIDPPYGMKLDTWDVKLDVAFFTEQIKRLGREFYAVFGQMPYIREWDREAEKQGLHFLEHISWVKRNSTPGGNDKKLKRGHEEIYIYTLQERKDFYCLHGKFEDVKVPGLLFDVLTIQSIQRYISSLRRQIVSKKKSLVSCGSEKGNLLCQRYSKSQTIFDLSSEFHNYTNVWSFLPAGIQKRNGKKHPAMKPLLLIKRLVEMLTPEYGSVLDCFSGSGTTAIACQHLNRRFLCIEKEQDFYEQSVERLKNDTFQSDLPNYESNTNELSA
jgi:DNA modification methylase